jgi:hypothetical protein
MTPQEKANEIVHEYLVNTPLPFYIEDAKICALIAVDEILSEYWSHNTERRDWWKQVKQEIENL